MAKTQLTQSELEFYFRNSCFLTLPEPDFSLESGCFILKLMKKNPSATEVTPEVTPEVHHGSNVTRESGLNLGYLG